MQATCRILAIRHGQTAWNAEQRLQGHLDIGLDETGRWQAAQLARRLADEGVGAIYCSDLQRALDTARALQATPGAPLARHPGLRERHFGVLEGHTYAEIDRRWPQDALAWRQRHVLAMPGGGECLLQFYNRCVGVTVQLAAAHPGDVVAVVAHGGVLDCLYRAATGSALDAPRSWELGNASINRLLWTPQGLSLVGWNDDQHLLHQHAVPRDPALGLD
jgi:2,3-bisphosphoglycerate-dependent phosphoglycerate mutase